MRSRSFLIVSVLSLLFAETAFAQLLCIKEKTAELRSSPSLSGSYVKLQVPLNYPLLVQDEQGDFLHVRDYCGRDSWVLKSAVGKESGIIVNTRTANLRSGPGKDREILFKARRGVTFSVLQNQNGWLYVEHESGKKGWIYQNVVWGL